METPDPDDAKAMARIQAGDDCALNELMTRWQQPLAAFLFRYTGQETTAIDLAQETFVRAYENRQRYRGGQFSSWLFAIAVNLAKNHVRWQSRHPAVSLDALVEEPAGRNLRSNTASPSDEAASAELAAAVRDAVQALPHDLKTVTLLFEYQEQSHREIADALGCSAKAVETRLYRARQILREKLAAWVG
ncbi:MAG: sigma-70 family RNA polymerase sigma factor [Verrucomicrobiota bacterium]